MANWYVSSVAYAAVAQWQASTAYSLGQIRRQLAAPATNRERCFRVTTAGTSGGTEPSWNFTNNSTTNDNTVVWTECTGQEAHQHDNGVTTTWTAPANKYTDLSSATSGKNVIATGDSIYFSSDHSETQTSATLTFGVTNAIMVSVNKAGSVPPVAGDIATGATFITTGANAVFLNGPGNWIQGLTLIPGNAAAAGNVSVGATSIYVQDCLFDVSGAGTATFGGTGGIANIRMNNTKIKFGSTLNGLNIGSTNGAKVLWENTPNAITSSGRPLTSLFNFSPAVPGSLTVDGVDLTNSGATNITNSLSAGTSCYLRNCILPSSFTNYLGAGTSSGAYLEIINCDTSNTNYNCRWSHNAGSILTSVSTYRNGGATDGVTPYSREMMSNGNSTIEEPLEQSVWKWNDTTGSAQTATIEISSSASLNNNDVWMELFYLGESGSPRSDLGSCGLATILTAAAAQPSSTETWTSGAGTNQKLQVTFIAQKKGLLHAVVRLAKASTVVYIDPIITLS